MCVFYVLATAAFALHRIKAILLGKVAILHMDTTRQKMLICTQ